MAEQIGLDWIRELSDKSKGRVGTAIAEAYLIENIPCNPEILHTDFRNCDVHVGRVERGEVDGISHIDAGTERNQTISWTPDIELKVLERIDLDDVSRRRAKEEYDARISKKVFGEVKTSTSQRTPTSRIPENQSKLAHFLTQDEDTVVLAVLLTVKTDNILIEPYKMVNGSWTEIEFSNVD